MERGDACDLVVPGAQPAEVGAVAAAGGHVLIDLRPVQRGLEDLFFQFTSTTPEGTLSKPRP